MMAAAITAIYGPWGWGPQPRGGMESYKESGSLNAIEQRSSSGLPTSGFCQGSFWFSVSQLKLTQLIWYIIYSFGSMSTCKTTGWIWARSQNQTSDGLSSRLGASAHPQRVETFALPLAFVSVCSAPSCFPSGWLLMPLPPTLWFLLNFTSVCPPVCHWPSAHLFHHWALLSSWWSTMLQYSHVETEKSERETSINPANRSVFFFVSPHFYMNSIFKVTASHLWVGHFLWLLAIWKAGGWLLLACWFTREAILQVS